MSWSELTQEWLDELASDDAYEAVVTPLLIEVLEPVPDALYLDLGCGEGRVMRSMRSQEARVHGIELNQELAVVAGSGAIVAALPRLQFLRSDAYRGAYCVLALEHVEDHQRFFEEAARVVEPGGSLAVVMNHPVWTAPGSTPVTDDDGEVLWRPGSYFHPGQSTERMGESHVVFYHRPLGALLESASHSGWSLTRARELPHHDLEDQADIPRLLSCLWRLLP